MLKSTIKNIGDYGIIGDMYSAALVGIDGSIDWCCLPCFDSPSLFASILDEERGGCFRISPLERCEIEQIYEPNTNLLTTTFYLPSGIVQLTDFMPCFIRQGDFIAFHEIHRHVCCLEGKVNLRILFEPRLNYARGRTKISVLEQGCMARNGNETVTLASDVRLSQRRDSAISKIGLNHGDEAWFIVKYGEEQVFDPNEHNPEFKLEKTRSFWECWIQRCSYSGRWRNEVLRSALTLKLLTYEPTGAMIAAPTTSLPEEIGGVRNWDYRYSWVRDSVFSIWAFYLLGYGGIGLKYVNWLVDLCHKNPEKLCIMYGIDGNEIPAEEELKHLRGYKNSRPVRIGNNACTQFQQDIYGMVVDALYFLHKHIGGISKDCYENVVRPLVNYVCSSWDKPDHGIWEVRARPKHFVHSNVWCWVALDRGVRIAKHLGYDEDVDNWKSVRKAIKKEILSKGWSKGLNAFKICYGVDGLDAAHLLMPLVRFLSPHHPKVKATIKMIEEKLAKHGLVRRYKVNDGLRGGEGAFTVSSFWLVDCLIKLDRLNKAKNLFEKLLTYANHLGLYSEEIDPSTGKLLGNFPQAYVHMGLINSAINLDRAMSRSEESNS